MTMETRDDDSYLVEKDHDICLAEFVRKQNVDMTTQRIALVLKSGSTYFVAEVVDEWKNAVHLLPEGHDVPPVLVFKDCIEVVKVMDRPVPRKKERDE
jgi:hypothetical protein